MIPVLSSLLLSKMNCLYVVVDNLFVSLSKVVLREFSQKFDIQSCIFLNLLSSRLNKNFSYKDKELVVVFF